MKIFFENGEPTQLETLKRLLQDSPAKNLLVHDQSLHPSSVCATYSLASGEATKSLSQAEQLLAHMQKLPMDRTSTLACLGGGTLSDLTGFCASIYQRGIPLALIPTTLLSMVDAAVGGKNGVNFQGKKNGIGTLFHPKWLIINPLWLRSLPWNEYKQGLAEIVKYGVIQGDPLLDFLEKNVQPIQNQEPNVLAPLIQQCIGIKQAIVKESEISPEARDVLNFGHTFGHAVEAATNFQIPHGNAVAMGMMKALEISARKCGVDRNETLRVKRLLEAFDLPTEVPEIDKELILHWMQQDKKNRFGKICLILASKIGNVARFADVPLEEVREIL